MNIRRCIAPFLLLALVSPTAIAEVPREKVPIELPAPITQIQTDQGTILGNRRGNSVLFKGIPYARPPIGPLRWKPPQPVARRNGTLSARNFGPRCPQARLAKSGSASEDCLTLNIATPASALMSTTDSLPVFFSIHGGGFVNGSGQPVFAVAPVLNASGIILVTMNYRLGALGFYAHPLLDMKQGANFALLDLVAALRWVHDNIDAFGGDPERVTIQGISAGGQAVNMLMVNPQARGLFAGAIAQSGYGAWPLQPHLESLQDATESPSAEQISAAIASRASGKNASELNVKELYALSAEQLFGAILGFHLPIIDSITLPDETAVMFARGQQHPVPYISGGTGFDGSVFPFSGVSEETLLDLTGAQKEQVYALWAEDFSAGRNQGVKRLFGDIRYLYSGWSASRSMAAIHQPGYLYLFDYLPPDTRAQQAGAAHGSDGTALWADYRSTTAQMMREYWMNFVKTGNPNGKALPHWKTANTGVQSTNWLLFGEQVAPVQDIRNARLQFIDQLWRARVAVP